MLAFAKGDKIVHPMYGAGVIDNIEEKSVDGQTKPYYIIKIPINDLQVSVSVNKANSLHMRQVLEKTKLMDIIAKAEFKPNASKNWTTTYNENLLNVKSGDIEKVAGVLKYLSHKERGKTLSTAEKKLMNSAKQIVLSEIILSCGIKRSDAELMLKKSMD